MAYQYYAIYKPYGMLSQFSKDGKRPRLGALGHFDEGIYPVGRLDATSEGLLILTNNKSLNHALLKPINAHRRIYYAQVDGVVTDQAIVQLEEGIDISIQGVLHRTRPAKASRISPPVLPPRHPPVRVREDRPNSWLQLELIEGKNRQVRRMTAAVGFPTLRLVRYAIEDVTIDGMASGDVFSFKEDVLFEKLKIVQ